MKFTAEDKIRARETLESLCPPGTEIVTLMRHRSRSGMARWYDAYVIRDGELLRLTWSIAALCGMTYDRRYEAIRVGRYDFDGGFRVVCDLGYYLYAAGKTGAEADAGPYSLKHRSI